MIEELLGVAKESLYVARRHLKDGAAPSGEPMPGGFSKPEPDLAGETSGVWAEIHEARNRAPPADLLIGIVFTMRSLRDTRPLYHVQISASCRDRIL